MAAALLLAAGCGSPALPATPRPPAPTVDAALMGGLLPRSPSHPERTEILALYDSAGFPSVVGRSLELWSEGVTGRRELCEIGFVFSDSGGRTLLDASLDVHNPAPFERRVGRRYLSPSALGSATLPALLHPIREHASAAYFEKPRVYRLHPEAIVDVEFQRGLETRCSRDSERQLVRSLVLAHWAEQQRLPTRRLLRRPVHEYRAELCAAVREQAARELRDAAPRDEVEALLLGARAICPSEQARAVESTLEHLYPTYIEREFADWAPNPTPRVASRISDVFWSHHRDPLEEAFVKGRRSLPSMMALVDSETPSRAGHTVGALARQVVSAQAFRHISTADDAWDWWPRASQMTELERIRLVIDHPALLSHHAADRLVALRGWDVSDDDWIAGRLWKPIAWRLLGNEEGSAEQRRILVDRLVDNAGDPFDVSHLLLALEPRRGLDVLLAHHPSPSNVPQLADTILELRHARGLRWLAAMARHPDTDGQVWFGIAPPHEDGGPCTTHQCPPKLRKSVTHAVALALSESGSAWWPAGGARELARLFRLRLDGFDDEDPVFLQRRRLAHAARRRGVAFDTPLAMPAGATAETKLVAFGLWGLDPELDPEAEAELRTWLASQQGRLIDDPSRFSNELTAVLPPTNTEWSVSFVRKRGGGTVLEVHARPRAFGCNAASVRDGRRRSHASSRDSAESQVERSLQESGIDWREPQQTQWLELVVCFDSRMVDRPSK